MFKLKVINTSKLFVVEVYKGETKIWTTGWHGGEFIHENVKYAVYGPYHGLDGTFDQCNLMSLSSV